MKKILLGLVILIVVNLYGCSTPVEYNEENLIVEEELDDTKAEPIKDTMPTNDSIEVYGNWEDAYSNIILNIESNLVDPYNLRTRPNKYFYIGIHDFDNDNIPELVIGDSLTAAIFTYENNTTKKIADLYGPEDRGCINGLNFTDNKLFLVNNGSDGSGYVGFTYHEGEYVTGIYDDYSPKVAYINEKKVSGEEFRQLFNITEFYEHEHLKNIVLPENRRIEYIIMEEENKGTLIINEEEIEIDNLDFSILQW